MLQNLRNRASEESGFTLIELLVVILIIGILAAIALPTFLGQKDKAKDASAKSDARNAVTQIESCLVDEPVASTCKTSPQVKVSGSVTIGTVTDQDNYDLYALSGTGTKFTITKSSANGYVRSCDQPNTGACPSTGSW